MYLTYSNCKPWQRHFIHYTLSIIVTVVAYTCINALNISYYFVLALSTLIFFLSLKFLNDWRYKPILFYKITYILTKFLGLYLLVKKCLFKKNKDISMRFIKGMLTSKYIKIVPNFHKEAKALENISVVQQGLKALRVKSILHAQALHLRHKKTPFTHPLRKPYFYIPGIPATPFYDSTDDAFPWVAELESAYSTIKGELMSVLHSENKEFTNFISEFGSVPNWDVIRLFYNQHRFEENCQLFPQTTAILEHLPIHLTDQTTVSMLNPHSSIGIHAGPVTGMLRVHLPLIVPEHGASIVVCNQTHTWKEGKVMIFDDSFVHSAYNNSDEIRVVLMITIWHPSFSSQNDIIKLNQFRTVYG